MKIFEPCQLNSTITLKNRFIMAPMTRCFNDENLVPIPEMATYYAKRAGAGLIISEATKVHPSAQGYPRTPGIYTQKQIEGWKMVTDAVHVAGGKIFNQIWHTGRLAHSHYTGQQPIAPSETASEGRVPRTKDKYYEIPRTMTTEEVKEMVQHYIQAAKNAMKAGFDGIEIHGANGYLIDQFLHQKTNFRTDEYGGSTANCARFALEIIQGIIEAIGNEKVGIRLSPAAHHHMEHTAGDEDTFKYLLEKLNKLDIAYVHGSLADDKEEFDYLGGRVTTFLRKHYTGTVIGCGSYTVPQAKEEIKSGKVDLVAFGRLYIADHDLVEKSKAGTALSEYANELLYTLS